VGVFAGYYGRADLTAEVLIDVDGEQCYATGDYARLDSKSGQLVFIGRRDFQVKLRGQRIELGQIEQAVMAGSVLISGCIVVKYTYHGQDHLLAYVETSSDTLKEDELREQCLSRLPSYMVPSMFVILERFPLSANGKIDRKALSSVDFLPFSTSPNKHTEPISQMEERVHDLWCDVLHMKYISIKTSFFALHGTSLLFMKLYNLYRLEFGMAPDIVACLRYASITEHAQLLTKVVTSTTAARYQAWTCLYLNHGKIMTSDIRRETF
jgi:hypothetical protein